MRIMMTLAVLACFSIPAYADEPKFFLNPDGSVEQRLAGVESKTALLERRIADLEKQLAPRTELAVADNPKAAPKKVRFQVCVNGKCSIHECDNLSQVPAGASVLSAASSCPTGPCGDACACASGACDSGACPTGVSASSGDSLFSRVRNRPGLRGRLRGGCSTCQ